MVLEYTWYCLLLSYYSGSFFLLSKTTQSSISAHPISNFLSLYSGCNPDYLDPKQILISAESEPNPDPSSSWSLDLSTSLLSEGTGI